MGFKSRWIVFTENGNGIENPEKIFCRDRDRDGFPSSERRSGSGWKNPVPPHSISYPTRSNNQMAAALHDRTSDLMLSVKIRQKSYKKIIVFAKITSRLIVRLYEILMFGKILKDCTISTWCNFCRELQFFVWFSYDFVWSTRSYVWFVDLGRSNNVRTGSMKDSCMLPPDLKPWWYLFVQGHTENLKENRSLCKITVRLSTWCVLVRSCRII